MPCIMGPKPTSLWWWSSVFWIANILLLFAICIEGENDRSKCINLPSSPRTRPVKIRTGCKSNLNWAPWAAMCWLYLKCLDKLWGCELPAPEQVHISVCFLGSASKFKPPQFFWFYLWGHLKPLVYSAWIENGHFLSSYFMRVSPFATAPEPLKGCPCIYWFRWKTLSIFFFLWNVTW